MEIIVFPIHAASIVAICIMVGSLIFAHTKKMMMTHAIIIANLLVFILTLLFQDEIIGSPAGYVGLGFRPIYLSTTYFPQIYTLFTSMFIHGGFTHILGNMLIFFFMGTAFEQRIGWKKFLTIYLITGICGALTHSLFNLESTTTLIGASGAIFGILGAFAFSYPKDEVVMPIPVGIMLITRIKVIYAAIIFAGIETLIVWMDIRDNTAHLAHLGGLISGILLAAILLNHAGKTRNIQRSSTGYHLYYEPTQFQRPSKIKLSNLEKLAENKEMKEILKRIESETLPQVRDIWIDHFLEKSRCPRCKKPLNFFDRKIWCENCGFKTDY